MLRYRHCRTEWLGPSGQADFVTQGARPRPPSSSSSALKPEKLKGRQARLHRLMRQAVCMALASSMAPNHAISFSGSQVILKPKMRVL